MAAAASAVPVRRLTGLRRTRSCERRVPDGGAAASSFIADFPGLDTSWLLLGLAEAVAFLGIIASLITGEFLRDRAKPILIATLAFSMFTFALMAFAQNMIAAHDSVPSLLTYMGVTAVVLAMLKFVPPFRGRESES